MTKNKPNKDLSFKLTYATMFDPPEELHSNYEKALKRVKKNLGQDYPMIIGGKDVRVQEKIEDRSPINQGWLLGTFQKGNINHAQEAIKAARDAFPDWSRTPWKKRVNLLHQVAKIIDERVYDIAAVLSLEVGKNRMEALADIAETADLIRYACDQFELNNGFVVKMKKEPLKGLKSSNTSVLRPHGVWLVISPFNFPAALTGGPAGAALLTGNTIVIKPASDTPWTVRLLAECFRDAGLPDGAINYITGPGNSLGNELINSPDIDGVTFTGSYGVGMHVYRTFAQSPYPRPTILEMGGKNASIISRKADLEKAASGIVRSAFGLQGQKCSANSRIFVEKSVYDDLVERIVSLTENLKVGDPTQRATFMGPVINSDVFAEFQEYSAELSQTGSILTGGEILTQGEFSKGFFCQPTVAADVPIEHRLWKHEMFLPITMLHRVKNIDEAIELTNDSQYGLTAGFYGSENQTRTFFDRVEAGVCYANRAQGATTGAWPGYQPFGGWKASGSTGKNAGGRYYLPLYMHEQSQTNIR